MVHDVRARHWFTPAKPGANRHVADLGIPGILFSKRRFVWMVQRQHDRQIRESCERHTGHVVEVNDIDGCGRIPHRPCAVVEILQLGSERIADRPLAMRIPPFDSARQPRVSIRVNRYVMTARVETTSKIRDKQLSSAIPRWRDSNKRGGDDPDAHDMEGTCKKDSSSRQPSHRSAIARIGR